MPFISGYPSRPHNTHHISFTHAFLLRIPVQAAQHTSYLIHSCLSSPDTRSDCITHITSHSLMPSSPDIRSHCTLRNRPPPHLCLSSPDIPFTPHRVSPPPLLCLSSPDTRSHSTLRNHPPPHLCLSSSNTRSHSTLRITSSNPVPFISGYLSTPH